MREIWLDLDMLGEPLKNAKEKEIIGSLSPQVSICEEDGPIFTEGRDTSIKPLSIDEMRSSAITETLDPKVMPHEFACLSSWMLGLSLLSISFILTM